MTSITQTIPSFTGGMSQQPDELVLPGQVKELLNGIPDITDGLVKRPGSRFVRSLSSSAAGKEGVWFSYYRDRIEGAYIGFIHRSGTVRIWHANDVTLPGGVNKVAGDPAVVNPSNAIGYLSHASNDDLKFLTIADTTFVTNSTVPVERSLALADTSDGRGVSIGSGVSNKFQAFVELRQLAHGREYSFDVHTPTAAEESLTPDVSTYNPGVPEKHKTGKALNIAHTNATGFTTIARGSGTNTYTGIDPNLQHQCTEIFIVSDGIQARNLVFRLTVTGQVAVSPNAVGTPESTDYIGVYNTSVELLSGGYGWAMNQTFTVNDGTGVTHTIEVKEVQQLKVKKDLGFFRPDPTSFDANLSVSADGILSQVEQGVGTGKIALNVAEVIGNGIFLAHDQPFVVETKQPDLWRITPMEVNDVSELPRQCKNGMIIKVVNSSDSQEDDYFLKFIGDADSDGPGRWEETIAPETHTSFNANTLPHIIQRQADGSFTVGTYNWSSRQVGDDNTNPFPSLFADATALDNNNGKKINQTFFHRNRLGFLCEDNVILSRAGEPGNFFQDSALVIGASDPIDIEASSTQPTLLKNAIETNTGLIIFAETQQFMLHTDSDSLTPETAKVSNISTYRYSPKTDPISLGTTIGFVDNAGAYGRFFEMFDIRREGEPSMVEQSKVVPRILPNNLDIITNSRENNTIFFAKSGFPGIIGYRYFNTGDRRVQSAWFAWVLPFNIQHLFVIDDELYIIESFNYNFFDPVNSNLLKIPLHDIDNALQTVGDDFYGDNIPYDVHLDSAISLRAGAYDGTYTTVTFDSAGNGTTLGAVNLATGETFISDPTQRVGTDHKFLGNFGGLTVVVGWLYEMKVDMPRIFVKQKAGEITTSDITASLTIQRVNLRFGPVGQIDVDLKRLGKPTVTTQYDATPMDFYDADEATFVEEKTQQVPVYERSKNCNLTLKSFHPGPASLRSMTWEGDYTPMHHKRV